MLSRVHSTVVSGNSASVMYDICWTFSRAGDAAPHREAKTEEYRPQSTPSLQRSGGECSWGALSSLQGRCMQLMPACSHFLHHIAAKLQRRSWEGAPSKVLRTSSWKT